MASDREAPSYDPAGEVVDLCRELIRIDTTNYGDDDGPGERKAAEYVAALLDEVGIESELFESEPGRTSVVARWGGADASRSDALLLHGHLDVVPAAAEDWQVDPFSGEVRDGYVWGRGAVDMKDFDAMLLSVVRARAARRRGAGPADRAVLHRRRGGRRAPGRRGRWSSSTASELEGCTEAVGEVGGFSATVRGRRALPDRGRREGHGLDEADRAGPGRPRLDDQPRQRRHHAWPRPSPGSAPTSGRCGSRPTMEVLLAAVGELAGTEATPENAEALVEEFGGAARMLGAVIRNTANPTMLGAGYKVNVIPTEATAHVDGRFLPGYEDEFFATLAELCGEDIDDRLPQPPAAAWETPYDGALVDAMTRCDPRRGPGRASSRRT